jgi:hypothetical protein
MICFAGRQLGLDDFCVDRCEAPATTRTRSVSSRKAAYSPYATSVEDVGYCLVPCQEGRYRPEGRGGTGE